MGINLFENAYFGKPYKTRDGRKALYCYKFTKNSYALIVEGGDEFWYVRDDGLVDDWDDSFMDSSYYTDNDIVSEWTYEVEEPSKEQMIAKYLYENKGYPIDLNGNLPSFEETMKDVELYNKYKMKKLIDKACDFIRKNFKNDYQGKGEPVVRTDYSFVESIIEDLTKYMED